MATDQQTAEMAYFEIREYCADIFLEAHVNHAICLVKTQITANFQIQHLLVEHVHETTRCCSYHMNAPEHIIPRHSLNTTLHSICTHLSQNRRSRPF